MKQRKTCSIMWVSQLIALPVQIRYYLFVVNVNYGSLGGLKYLMSTLEKKIALA